MWFHPLLKTTKTSILLITGFLLLSPASLAQKTVETTSLTDRIQQSFIGDLEQIRERRILRVLVSHNRTNFFETRKGRRGIEYDLLRAYENYLNRGPRRERYKTHVVFLVRPFNQLFNELLQGRGDLIASGLTITPERSALVDFTDPYITDIQEVLISHKGAPPITRLEDLAGKRIIAVANSSYIIHLRMFNQFLGLHGLEPIEIVQADPLFEAEDVLELVNAGIYLYTVADNHIAEIYQKALENIEVHEDMVFHHGGQIAWALNRHLPELKESLNAFIHTYARQGRLLGNSLYRKYFENAYWIRQPELLSEIENTECLSYYLQLYSEFYGFDWFLIAAQAYQESKFNQNLTSHAGAYGIMQIKPSTASSKNVGIKNIKTLENNIHAGVKYLAFLRDTYFSGPEYSPEDQINFSLAAYNAGPGRVRKMQRQAHNLGLNPNKWFYNVEVVARNTIGHETVDYVTKIQKTKFALKSYKTLSDTKKLLKAKQLENDLDEEVIATSSEQQEAQQNTSDTVQ